MGSLPSDHSGRPTAAAIDRLGTETAFAVSADAAAWAAQGHRVYPFHLGDINLRTPLNIIEAAERAMRDGKTGYTPAPGTPELREALAEEVGAARGVRYGPEHVSVQPGAKPIIGKLLMSVMDPGEEVVYPNPGYPIYESQVDYLGGRGRPYAYVEEADGFRIDRASVEAALSDATRVLIVNGQHNPTGADASADEIAWLATIARERDLWVLADEPYFDIRYGGSSHSLVSEPEMVERTVIGYTFSKTYAMTGWRLGAAIGPARVIELITRLNTNHESCTCGFIQHGGVEALKGDQSGAREILATLRERRDVVVDGLNAIDGVSVHRATATFYLFVDVTGVYRRLGYEDPHAFRMDALRETGVSFCSRTHFGRALPGDQRMYVRFAYSGIDTADAAEGLAALKEYWER